MTKYRLEREKYWISTLQSVYPLGLNVRVKGIGYYTPSQANYHHFGGRARRKRPHGKRKPKRLRPSHDATVSFVMAKHHSLQNSPNYIHYFKQYLYSLPRRQLAGLYTEVRLPNDSTAVLIKDLISMVAQQRLYQPVRVTPKKERVFCQLDFIDKGLDFINISGILNSPSVQSKVPLYFQERDPPIIGYRYNPSIAGLLFNYKKALSSEVIRSFDVDNFQCGCQESRFRDPHHGHIITGDLDIVQNRALKKILKKGPKYRLPRKINWERNRENLKNFIEEHSKKWIAREKKNSEDRNLTTRYLQDWKTEVMRLIDKRIEAGKRKFKSGWTLQIKGQLKEELTRLQQLFVITPTDKAQNNISFTCKPFYIKILGKELTSPGINTYQLTNLSLENVIQTTSQFSETLGIEVKEEMRDIPIIYWIPKQHKNPTSQRFIAGSKFCTIKMLSKLFLKFLKLILSHLTNYNRTVFTRSGLKYFWIIDNSLSFLENIKDLKTDHLETYDFSTLYTSLPHSEIKDKFKLICKNIFSREGKRYINVNYYKAFFSNNDHPNFFSFTERQLLQI